MSLLKFLHTVDSTNNYAMQQIHEGLATHGMAWAADLQTNGKGQRGKTWHAKEGENIALSIVLNPIKLKIEQQFQLSIVVALACKDFFEEKSRTKTFIKWPNDIYCNDRKAVGILIENVISGNYWKWAVVGVGININQLTFDSTLTNAISLKQITNITYNVYELVEELYALILKNIDLLFNNNFIHLWEKYHEHLYKINSLVKLKKQNIVFECLIKGVNNQGKLICGTEIEQLFDVGEIEWLI